VQPADAISARFPAGDLQASGGRVDRGDRQAAAGERAGQSSGSAADVQYAPSAEFFGYGSVDIQVGAVRV